MILHHEVITAAGSSLFASLAWLAFAGNAAVYYGRRAWRRYRGGK